MNEHERELYARWKTLINMSASRLEAWVSRQVRMGKKEPRKYPGLKPSAATRMGISSGVESARWIVRMKRTPVGEWSPKMWRWAGKQVSFVSRMSGSPGPLYDEKGQPTRKLLSLKVWGHDPTMGAKP